MEQKTNTPARQAVGIPMEFVEKAKELAKIEERTLSNMFAVLIKEALQARGIEC